MSTFEPMSVACLTGAVSFPFSMRNPELTENVNLPES